MAKRARATFGRRARSKGNGSNSNGSNRLFDDVLALASTIARGRKESGADKLLTLAASAREFATSLSDMPNLRQRATAAANSLEGMADYVLHTEIDEMVDDAGVFARRHPVMTIALSVGAGIAASSYLRANSGLMTRSNRRHTGRKSPTVRRAKPQPRSKTDDRPGASA